VTFQDRGYQVEKELGAASEAFEADSFGPTTCPSRPSFVPCFAFQLRLASTPSSCLRTTPLKVLDRLSEYPCRLPPLMSRALVKIGFVKVSHLSCAVFPLL
jgi:hypothetical protein